MYTDYFNYVWDAYSESKTVPEIMERIAQSDSRTVVISLLGTIADTGDVVKLSKILWDTEHHDPFGRAKTYVARHWGRSIQSRSVEYLDHSVETQHRLVFILKQAHNFYRPIKANLASVGDEVAERFERAYGTDPARFVSTTMKLDQQKVHGLFVVHVSPLIGRWSHVVLRDPSIADYPNWAILGSEVIDDIESSSRSEDIDWFVRLFSDKTRLEILHRMNRKPWYGAELARTLHVSRAAISYHMVFFFQMDLVTIAKTGRRYYYTLSRERLEDLWERGKLLILD